MSRKQGDSAGWKWFGRVSEAGTIGSILAGAGATGLVTAVWAGVSGLAPAAILVLGLVAVAAVLMIAALVLHLRDRSARMRSASAPSKHVLAPTAGAVAAQWATAKADKYEEEAREREAEARRMSEAFRALELEHQRGQEGRAQSDKRWAEAFNTLWEMHESVRKQRDRSFATIKNVDNALVGRYMVYGLSMWKELGWSVDQSLTPEQKIANAQKIIADHRSAPSETVGPSAMLDVLRSVGEKSKLAVPLEGKPLNPPPDKADA